MSSQLNGPLFKSGEALAYVDSIRASSVCFMRVARITTKSADYVGMDSCTIARRSTEGVRMASRFIFDGRMIKTGGPPAVTRVVIAFGLVITAYVDHRES
jgi:hypothetical protein